MRRSASRSLVRRRVIWGLAAFVLITLVSVLAGRWFQRSLAEGLPWSPPVNISNTPNRSWFPDLAVDEFGNVHVVWCETSPPQPGYPGEYEQVLYAFWNGQRWSSPNDIVPPQLDIRRNAIAASAGSDLFMVVNRSSPGRLGLVFTVAPQRDAWSAADWSTARVVDARGGTYMADLAVDHRGRLHLLFDDRGYHPSEEIAPYADMYYRRSTDDGRTWSIPINLARSSLGSSRGQLEIDASGTVHATWDEGWDRLSGDGVPTYSVYRSSADGGLSWSAPITVAYPTTGTAQLVSGADGQGGVMLVWRTTSHDEIFFQWSADHGQHWSGPKAVPEVYARPWAIPFDLYDMAADSAGNIHLLVVGREIPERLAPVRVYQLVWDGESWSRPTAVSSEGGFPEYPRLVISEGNHLHAVWFVRESLWGESNHEVWYWEAYSAAPHETPVPSPTPPPTVTVAPSPTCSPAHTSYPTLPVHGQLPTDLYTETDRVLRLGLALSPVLLLLLLARVFRRARS